MFVSVICLRPQEAGTIATASYDGKAPVILPLQYARVAILQSLFSSVLIDSAFFIKLELESISSTEIVPKISLKLFFNRSMSSM
jgi:hypothetical protein